MISLIKSKKQNRRTNMINNDSMTEMKYELFQNFYRINPSTDITFLLKRVDAKISKKNFKIHYLKERLILAIERFMLTLKYSTFDDCFYTYFCIRSLSYSKFFQKNLQIRRQKCANFAS